LEKKKTKMDKNGQKWTEFADHQITCEIRKMGRKMGRKMERKGFADDRM
jgi:hypothetical protein